MKTRRGTEGRTPAWAIVGATATGKSELAERLAAALDAEIVCCDSRQVFAELEIGTGKPTPLERAARPHHLFDALRLGVHPSAGWYARAAREACAAVRARGRTPLLVGGSGLYLRALREGLAPTPPHDPAVRARLKAELDAAGPVPLHARLRTVDPATAARVGARDRQRIVRALEVAEASGRPLSWWHAHTPEPASGEPEAAEAWRVVEVVVEPAELRERIARRTGWMFAHGLIGETEALLKSGAGDALRALQAIGYDEAREVIEGTLAQSEAEARVNLRTAQLAKRQRTWFRHQVEAIRLEGSGDAASLARRAQERLGADGRSA
jgi:tRNA dimethylallyltransferase